ncbi:DNA repair protein RecO [Patescibacteria group bacterium]
MKKTYKTEGIVLKHINFGEADRILTVFTKHYGKVKAMAKGVRRVTSRKGGNLETFNQVTLFFVKGKNIDIVTEATAINTFSGLRNGLFETGLAFYFCELVDKLTPESQANQNVFELLVESLGKIGKTKPIVLVRNFEEELLKELGFGVPLSLKSHQGSLKDYIETITEKEIKTPKVLKRL